MAISEDAEMTATAASNDVDNETAPSDAASNPHAGASDAVDLDPSVTAAPSANTAATAASNEATGAATRTEAATTAAAACTSPRSQSAGEEASEPPSPRPTASTGRRWVRWGRRLVAVACVAGAGVAISLAWPQLMLARPPKGAAKNAALQKLRLEEDGSVRPAEKDALRIPLVEVVKFKEKQWFVEELEGARDGDPNAMMRLAKMYLHGQGCDKSMIMAQEWLRKARYLGVVGSLEELYAGDDWKAEKARAAAAYRREQKEGAKITGARK